MFLHVKKRNDQTVCDAGLIGKQYDHWKALSRNQHEKKKKKKESSDTTHSKIKNTYQIDHGYVGDKKHTCEEYILLFFQDYFLSFNQFNTLMTCIEPEGDC